MNEIKSNVKFYDSTYKYFKLLKDDDKDNLIIYIESWDGKLITIEFFNVIYFYYDLDYVILGLFELKEEILLKEAINNFAFNSITSNQFIVYGLVDINDHPFFKIIAEDVILNKLS